MSARSFRYLLSTAAAVTAVSLSANAQQPTTTSTQRQDTTGARTSDSTHHARTHTAHGLRVSKDRSGTTGTTGTMRDTTPMHRDSSSMAPATTPRDTSARRDSSTSMLPAAAATTGVAAGVASNSTDNTATTTPTSTTTDHAAATTSTASTTPAMNGRFGNGFYMGVSAGGSVPQGYFNDWYKSGWSVGVPFGWQRQGVPLGIRADVNYTRMSGKDFAISNFATGTTSDPQIWSGQLDLKLNLPLSKTSTWRPAFYLLGGGGVHYFKNFSSSFNAQAGTGTGTAFQTGVDESKSQTKFGLNGGAGLSFGIGQADLFVESRYVTVYTADNNTRWVPITVGLTFF